MNKLSTLFLSLGMAMATSFVASADDFTLGYAHGDDTDAVALEYSNTNAEASAAIYITPDYAKTMTGDNLNGATFYVRSRTGFTSAKLWVRESLDGPNLAESTTLEIQNLSYNKWNNVNFSAPYTIGDKGFYIGITWQQSKACKVVSYISDPCPDAAWTKAPGKEWNNTDIKGTLCIEGLVSGDKRCAYDAQLLNASFAKYFLLKEGFIKSEFTVYNQGTQPINGLTIEVGIEGLDPVSLNFDNEISVGQKVTIPAEIKLPITSTDSRNYKINYVKISKLGNGTDEYLANNEITVSSSFLVVNQTFPKRVLIDEFTGEWCPNCPGAANSLHQIQAMPEYESRIDALCHHIQDGLAIPEVNSLALLYNLPALNNSIFCPVFAVDRISVDNNYNGTAYTAPVIISDVNTTLFNLLNQQIEEYAVVGVDIDFDTPSGTDTSLKVTCTVRRSADILSDNGHITVYLVEDNVKPISQAGAGSTYKHQNVPRKVNSAWGEPIVWNNDNEFTYTYEFPLQDDKGNKYKLQDLHIQAVITEYETMKYGTGYTVNWDKARVYNTNCRMVAPDYVPESGIEDNLMDNTATVKAIYDSNGVQHNDYVDGINIVVMSDGTTHKIVK